MPLKIFQSEGRQAGWAVWAIAETEEELYSDLIGHPPPELTHERKRLEWLAGRHATFTLCNHLGLRYFGIRKDDVGKPHLERYQHHLSLSHSFPFVAAQLDPTRAVGVDLEQPREKLLAIAPRVLSPMELVDAGKDLVKLCVYWCAKEAMFKIHSRGGLFFSSHLQVWPFALAERGQLKGAIVDGSELIHVEMSYQVRPDYVLVTANQTTP